MRFLLDRQSDGVFQFKKNVQREYQMQPNGGVLFALSSRNRAGLSFADRTKADGSKDAKLRSISVGVACPA
jgi:hypothetical protein